MKLVNIIYSSLFLVVVMASISCDRIEHPVVDHSNDLNWGLFPGGDSTDYSWPVWAANTYTQQNVLLEDYTGHTCTNCPAAATIASGLEVANPGRVIVVSIHASTGSAFQEVAPPEFTQDFRTEAGNDYVNEIPNFFGNPSGTINRKGGGLASTNWFLSSAWVGKVNSVLNESPIAKIQLQYNYYPQTKGLFVHTETEFLNAVTEDFGMIIYLVRKSVIAAQKLNSGAVEEHYHHHNVLSDNLNGTWGTKLVTTEKSYNHFAVSLPDNSTDITFNIDNLALVTYVYNKATLEIAQVIKTDLE